ncbi:hypothetical protein D3C84_1150400 [compost metagenome]
MKLFSVFGEIVVAYADLVRSGGRVIIVGLVVDSVVPRRTTDASPDILIFEIEFGEEIHSVGNQTTAEVAITIVVVEAWI